MEMEPFFQTVWSKSEENLVSSSKIGIAVLIFSSNKLIKLQLVYLLSHVHFNLNTFGHALLFPALAEKVFDLRSPSA